MHWGIKKEKSKESRPVARKGRKNRVLICALVSPWDQELSAQKGRIGGEAFCSKFIKREDHAATTQVRQIKLDRFSDIERSIRRKNNPDERKKRGKKYAIERTDR